MQLPKSTFSIQAKPSFEATVEVPVPGDTPRELVLVFKHKTRDEANAYLQREPKEGDTDGIVLDEIVSGWKNVPEPYSSENMTLLCQNFAAAPEAIIDKYLVELGVLRRKNSKP